MTDKERNDIFFLNTRFVLIVLVVLANILLPLADRFPEAHAVVVSIFIFHIPVFVLVTGYFSKDYPDNPHATKILVKIALQYFIFQSLYSSLDYFVFQTQGTTYSFWAPYWMLWFLFSHFCWKLLLLAFCKLKHPIVTAIGLGVLVGYLPVDGIWFSLSRTIVFFPFFLAGYYFRGDLLRKAAGLQTVRLCAAAVLLLTFGATLVGAFELPIEWLFADRTYTDLQHTEWYAGLYRVGVYGLELAAALAFLVLQSGRLCRITEWGKRTVYVFLLHGMVIKLLAKTGLYRLIDTQIDILVLMGLALTLTVLLSQKKVMAYTHLFIDPEPYVFLKKNSA